MILKKFSGVFVRASILAALTFLAAPAVKGQLFENLEAFGNRLETGAPDILSQWGDEGPKGVASGDFNGDGLPDLAASNLDGTVTVYLNRGNGGFSAPLSLKTGARTLRGIAVADITGDGRPDIAAAAMREGKVILFAGRGGGQFDGPAPIPAWEWVRNLAAGDFDGDGAMELVAAGSGVGLRHYRRNAAGAFEAAADLRALDAGGYSRPVYALKAFRPLGAARDELAVAHAWSKQAWVLGNGAGGALEIKGGIPQIQDVYYLDVGPIAGPAAGSHPDLVTAHKNLGVVQVRRGNDSPERFSSEVYQEFQVPGGPRAVKVIDLDGDGWNDLAVVLRGLDRAVTYRNLNGKLVPAHEMPVGRSPRDLAAADFDGDGEADLAVINRLSSDISILTGYPGQAGFGALESVYLVDGEVADLKVLDMNGDRRDDVIQLHRASGDISIRFAGPRGELGPPVFYDMGIQPSALDLIDVNNDGISDSITANIGRSKDGGITVRLGDGSGGFGPRISIGLPEDAAGGLFALEPADFDGDGLIDLAAGYFDCRLAFYRGRGDGTFEFTRNFLFIMEARGMAAGDFDQDGDIDLAGASLTGAVVVLENRGNLMTSPLLHRTDYPAPGPTKFGTRELIAVDFNRDGDLDLLVGSGSGVLVYLGREGMGFELLSSGLPGTEFPASGLAAADLDGDGDKDLAVTCKVLSCITILTLAADGKTYLPALGVDVPSGGLLAAGDLDGDGHADLVGSGDVLWTALSSRRLENGPPPRLEGERQVLPHPVINEILAINNDLPLAADGGRQPDWVEFFNGSPDAVDLAGWKLILTRTDAPAEVPPRVYTFPPGSALGFQQHLLVICTDSVRSPYHTGFNLPGDGGALELQDPSGAAVDRVEYPAQRDNVSYARYRDGLPSFVFNNFPSPDRSNPDNGPVLPVFRLDGVSPASAGADVRVAPPRPGEPIRFFASGSDDVGIVSASVLYQRIDVPDEGQHRVILFDDGLNEDGGLQDGFFAGVLDPGLPAGAEIRFQVEVRDLSDEVIVLPGGADAAGEDPDGEFYTLAVAGDFPRLELSEVVARNDTGLKDEKGGTPDWVEIRNCSLVPVSLDGILLGEEFPASDMLYAFPQGTTLPPGGYQVVYCDDKAGQGPLHAPFSLELDGGRLVLIGTAARGALGIIDALEYGPQKPDVALARAGCGGRWFEAAPTPGAENPAGQSLQVGDVDASGALDITDPIVILGWLFLGEGLPCPGVADVNADGAIDITDPIALLEHLFLGGPQPAGGPAACEGAPAGQ